jgi:hypothetical protein
MQINGDPVAEIDIKASFLTIYHAKLGMPLEGREDPYARAGDRKGRSEALVHRKLR